MSKRNQNQQHQQERAQASTAAGGTARRNDDQALVNARTQTSVANYAAIFEGFEARGIARDDIEPRENVLTFNAWRALGRIVRRGESGVRIVTVVPCHRRDRTSGESVASRRVVHTTVFHVTQTEPLTPGNSEPIHAPASVDAERLAAIGLGYDSAADMRAAGYVLRLTGRRRQRVAEAMASDFAGAARAYANR